MLKQYKSGDFIERYNLIAETKFRAINESPLIIKFLEKMFLFQNEEKYIKYSRIIEELRVGMKKNLYENIDYYMFRDDINPQNTAFYIEWLIDSYEADIISNIKSEEYNTSDKSVLSEELNRFHSFTNDLRKIFYKDRHE
jgi:hypothetical protein